MMVILSSKLVSFKFQIRLKTSNYILHHTMTITVPELLELIIFNAIKI